MVAKYRASSPLTQNSIPCTRLDPTQTIISRCIYIPRTFRRLDFRSFMTSLFNGAAPELKLLTMDMLELTTAGDFAIAIIMGDISNQSYFVFPNVFQISEKVESR